MYIYNLLKPINGTILWAKLFFLANYQFEARQRRALLVWCNQFFDFDISIEKKTTQNPSLLHFFFSYA